MARFQVVIEQGKVPAGSAPSVAVRLPGTTVNVPGTIFAHPISGATLANPFTAAAGSIDFYLQAPQVVDLQVTPPGQPAQTVAQVPVSHLRHNYTPLTAFGGKVMNWMTS